jgi:hypothetical protein
MLYPITDLSPEERRAKHPRYAFNASSAPTSTAAGDGEVKMEGGAAEGGGGGSGVGTKRRAAAADLF